MMTSCSSIGSGHGVQASENIRPCPDGVYRWTYEFDMLRNPTIMFSVWKVLGIAFGRCSCSIFFSPCSTAFCRP